MDKNNYNQSWNPLNYAQNLCVVSNARNEETNQSFGANHQIVEQLSALNLNLNLQTNATNTDIIENSIDSNNGITKLVNELIDSNSRESLTIESNMNNVLIGDNPNIKSSRPTIGYNTCGDHSVYNCGDIALTNDHKFDQFGYQMNGSNTQSVYNINSMPFVSSQEVMSSQSYGQPIRSMSCLQPMPHRLSQNVNQSGLQPSVRFKSQPMPYNLNQSYHQIMPIMNQSLQENSQQNQRQLRSIRARNSSQNTVEPMSRLSYYLYKCFEQFKHLERERKKIESELIHTFAGEKISSANNIPIQRPPQNATKIDRLITDMCREHAKVITIVAKMEQLRGSELQDSIHNNIQKWLTIIRKLQMKRKDEMLTNAANAMTGPLVGDNFLAQICEIVKELAVTARAVRTSLWCAYVNTLFGQHFK